MITMETMVMTNSDGTGGYRTGPEAGRMRPAHRDAGGAVIHALVSARGAAGNRV